ncbi:beta-eliminating lyase-related protein [Flavobacteriaceae bacterium]|nr:beta-eliminating lyase-related protein [Flavobacteriaceae bacterium]MDC1539496.1 beta-eliminating lyase-related protein [Flavobacteriaceae bacterium]
MQIDLRSDTVTRPSKGMLDAMKTAKLGDDVYAEDPSVNALEARVASLFGKPKALFFPSGTMANQTAIKLHTQPGEQLICDKYAHVYNYEGGGVSFNSGVSCQLVDGQRGMMTATQVEAAINPPDFYHSPLTSLVTLENTTNKGGGACWDFNEILKIRAVCNAYDLGLHLDGARLWNALIAKSETPLNYGEVFDTISVCFSKGLGAPVGSMLVGDEALMNKALRIRKMLGGGMRQIGALAAAASYALDHQFDRLKDDHQKANAIAATLEQLDAVSSVEPVETNIVIFKLNSSRPETVFLNHLKAHDILVSDMGSGKLRMVTHLDYTDAMHTRLLELLRKS